jgi:hypothetical protein
MRLLLLLAILPAWAAEDANAILKRCVEAESRNWESAGQYTYVERADYFSFDKKGQATKDRSETHDVIFVEGLQYKKLVARNDKPLDAREAAKEDRKLRQTAAERRKQRQSGLLHKSVSLGSDEELLTLFDNRLLGEEEIRGRKTWVVESTPQPGRVPANRHEKEVLSWRHKLWIDQAENVPLKTLATVVGNGIVFKPGSTFTWEYEKVNQDAWLAVSGIVDAHLEFARMIKGHARTEYQNSNFRKFDVQSTITVGQVVKPAADCQSAPLELRLHRESGG